MRLVPVPHSVDTSADRIRALEHARPSARGRWYVVVEGGVVLDQFAVEASMEFAGTGEISALALRPGTQASSLLHRILAPSMEYLFQMMRVVERRRIPRIAANESRGALSSSQSRILRSHPSDQPHARNPERSRLDGLELSDWKDSEPLMATVRAGSGVRRLWVRGRTTRISTGRIGRQSASFDHGRDAGCPDSGGRSGVRILRAPGVFLRSQHSCAVRRQLCVDDHQLLPLCSKTPRRNLVRAALVPCPTCCCSPDVSRCAEGNDGNANQGRSVILAAADRIHRQERSADGAVRPAKHPGVPDFLRKTSYRRLARFIVLAGTLAFRTSLRL